MGTVSSGCVSETTDRKDATIKLFEAQQSKRLRVESGIEELSDLSPENKVESGCGWGRTISRTRFRRRMKNAGWDAQA